MRWLRWAVPVAVMIGGLAVGGPPAAHAAATANTWSTVRALTTARQYLGAVHSSADSRLYAVAGQNSGGALQSVEAYTPGSNTWSTLSTSDPNKQIGPGVASTSNGNVYVIGGNDGTGPQNKAAYYAPGAGTWTNISSLPTSRQYLGAAVGSDGRVYAIGGQTTSTWLRTVEAYDP